MKSAYKEINKQIDAEIELLDEIALNDPVLCAFESVYQQAKKDGFVNRFGRVCYEKAVANGK